MSISSRITQIEQHIGNAYDKIEDLGIDLTDVDKNINNISSMLENVWDEYPKVSVSDVEEASIDGTKKGRMKLDLKGNTEQDGQPSPDNEMPIHNVIGSNEFKIQNKNLFDFDYILQHKNDFVKESQYFIFLKLDDSFKKQFTVSTILKGTSQNFVMGFSDTVFSVGGNNKRTLNNGTVVSPKTFDFTNATNVYVFFGNGSTISDDSHEIDAIYNNYNIQLEQGTTVTDFVEHKEQNLPLSLRSKNLLDYKTVEATSNTTVQLIDNGFKVTGKYAGKVTITGLKPNTNYYLQYIRENITGNIQQVSIFGGTGTSQRIKDLTNPDIFNTGVNTTINIWFYTSIGGSDGESNFTNIQLEEGSPTDYDPYYNYELSKIGDAEDYFYKENEKWYLHKKGGEVTLDESENITLYQTSSTRTIFRYNIGDNFLENYEYLLCNYFIAVSQASTWKFGNISVRAGTKAIYFTVEGNTTLEDFKTWLSTHNTKVQYALLTPTNTEITETTLINQLEAIRKAQSYDDQTNITQTNEDLPFILNIEALKK